MADFSAFVVSAEVFRDTMLTISEITDLVPLAADATQYKIFTEHIPDWVEMPYFLLQHIAGGHEQSTPDARAIDAYWKITISTADMVLAVTAITALSKMHRLDPVLTSYATGNPDGNPVMRQYATIREQQVVFDRIPVQNRPYFQGGGIYRIRLIQE